METSQYLVDLAFWIFDPWLKILDQVAQDNHQLLVLGGNGFERPLGRDIGAQGFYLKFIPVIFWRRRTRLSEHLAGEFFDYLAIQAV